MDWVHNDSFQVADPSAPINKTRFGICEEFDDGLTVRAPGSCVGLGGRTGYSVKIVSKEFLKRDDLHLGGAGAGLKGGIMNKPPF